MVSVDHSFINVAASLLLSDACSTSCIASFLSANGTNVSFFSLVAVHAALKIDFGHIGVIKLLINQYF